MRRKLPLLLSLAALPALADDPPKLVQDGQTRTVTPWTTKGMTINPVAICFDPQGNLYIAESDRAGNAVQDTRHLGHLNAVEEDLKFRSVEDRRAQIKTWIAAKAFPADYFTKTEDRVRIVRDTDGNGVADVSAVFAGGFNDELDGIGAGVLWHDGKLYFTCIPHLWMLTPGADGLAKERTSLSFGYGVRWCFYGHDLHGVTSGPDGRIYFSLGDRGFNVKTKEGGELVGVDRGGVFRCWPDGTGLELVHEGLRNPQDLAFDDFGELFTGDNNCDSGDRARVAHIVEGGDSGWRQDVQSLPSRGPWNREAMWKTLAEVSGPARPAWSLPPLEYMGAGPSGILFNPGTGESKSLDRCLLMVDFYGSGATVHSFRCVPDGAGFRVADHGEYYKGATVTDIAWGYDGRLYLSDWGGGWDPNPNGNVFTVTNESVRTDAVEAAAIRQVQELFKAGFSHRAPAELRELLGHRDQRVRLAAQYEIAKHGSAETGALAQIAAGNGPLLGRVHAVWALGQIARAAPEAAASLVPLLADPEPELRAQAAKTLGDLGSAQARSASTRFVEMLKDPSAHVRFYAVLALGKLRQRDALPAVLALLDETGTRDVTLRHGASYALALFDAPDDLLRAAPGAGPGARMGIVLALRRQGHAAVAEFLRDQDAGVAIEAARAVYDNRVSAGMASLASLLDEQLPADRAIEPLMRRAIEANVLLGDDTCVMRLATFAARADAAEEWRRLALERLEGWDRPLKREGVWGNWADLPPRPRDSVELAVQANIGRIVQSSAGSDDLMALARLLEARYSLSVEKLLTRVAETSRGARERVALLEALTKRAPETLPDACVAVLEGNPPEALRARAEELLAKTDANRAVTALTKSVSTGTLRDRQRAVRLLGTIDSPGAAAALARLASDMRAGFLSGGASLELYEAAMKLPPSSPARQAVAALGESPRRPSGFSDTLVSAGGDPAKGREIFLHHGAAECLRCHTVNGEGGTAGPDLSNVGSRLSREKIVESVVEPAAVLTPGFGEVSAMPAMTQLLTPREVRDVVAYLATLRPKTGETAAAAIPVSHTAAPHGSRWPNWIFAALGIATLAMAWRGIVRRGA